MTKDSLTAAQLGELKELLLARRADLNAQQVQNRANLQAPTQTAGSVSQDENAKLGNAMREVNTRLTALDTAELARIDRALGDMEAGRYGLCAACGCAIAFERLRAEPMTEHCVPCKSAWEAQQAKRG
jgi:DnaK suppressor protein